MELVALISTGKGTWGNVNNIIRKGDWENIILIGEEYAEKFSSSKKSEFIRINFNQDIEKIKKDIVGKLKGRIKGVEVALCIDSGSGNEHAILISALLNIPVGVRFVSLSEKGVIYI